jgi:hypothetical protein
MVDSWSAQCGRRELPGTYGVAETNKLLDALDQMELTGKHVLVVGSQIPWAEACVLSKGASHVTTIEYGSISTTHAKMTTLTPADVRRDASTYVERFDSAVTYSSVEHSGLGRYGDAMNPWGDRQAVARIWCMVKPGGRLAIAVPAGDDAIVYNAHRSYGKVQLPHLLANWKQLWQSPVGYHTAYVVEK